MARFGFIKSEQEIHVKIMGKSYPVTKAGSGTPCLLICLGTPSFRTLILLHISIATLKKRVIESHLPPETLYSLTWSDDAPFADFQPFKLFFIIKNAEVNKKATVLYT